MIKLEFNELQQIREIQEYIKKRNNDPTKESINRVLLKITHINNFIIVCTDGFTLIKREFNLIDSIDSIHVNKEYYIELDSFKDLKTNVFKSRLATLEIGEEMAVLKTSEGTKIKRSLLEYTEYKGNFVNYNYVIPEKINNPAWIDINIDCIKAVMSANNSNILSIPVDIEKLVPGESMLTSILLDNNEEYVNLIMPVRKKRES